jgi:50S ribosomal protein L16 3-hydroxylase
MARFSARVLKNISWTEKDVAKFLGEYLTEPKPHVVFKPGGAPRRLAGASIRLDPKTQLLYSPAGFFMNGEWLPVARRRAPSLRELADRRELDGRRAAASGLAPLIYDWHRAGFVHLSKRTAT